MAEQKTKQNNASVKAFLDAIADEKKKVDSIALSAIMESATKEKAKMWGPAIIGFGSYHYKYESGHEGDAPLIAFSPRKANITLYLHLGLNENNALLETLGKHKTGKGCLYINKLEDVDGKVLKKIITESHKAMRKKYPA